MQKFQLDFIQFAIGLNVLGFGEFTLKSGRQSPYFFNSGLFNDGASLAQLGRFYADTIIHAQLPFDVLFGPAYKGIPLAAATAIALADHHRDNHPYAFNRKEAKDHGEGGLLVGAPLRGKVLIIDDVISAGTSVRESVSLIKQAGAEPVGVVIALDRQELGKHGKTAIEEMEQELGLRVISIVTLGHLINFMEKQPELKQQVEAVKAYRLLYGKR